MSTLLQKPKLRPEVRKIAGETRFQLNRRTFYQLERSKNGLPCVVAGCPSLQVLCQSYFLAGEGEAGDFYWTQVRVFYTKPLESKLLSGTHCYCHQSYTHRACSVSWVFPHNKDLFVLNLTLSPTEPLVAEKTCRWMDGSSCGHPHSLRMKFFPGLEPGALGLCSHPLASCHRCCWWMLSYQFSQ